MRWGSPRGSAFNRGRRGGSASTRSCIGVGTDFRQRGPWGKSHERCLQRKCGIRYVSRFRSRGESDVCNLCRFERDDTAPVHVLDEPEYKLQPLNAIRDRKVRSRVHLHATSKIKWWPQFQCASIRKHRRRSRPSAPGAARTFKRAPMRRCSSSSMWTGRSMRGTRHAKPSPPARTPPCLPPPRKRHGYSMRWDSRRDWTPLS